MKILKDIKKGIRITLIIFKSFFNAVTHVAWGIASIFLLNITLLYLLKEGVPTSVNDAFIIMEQFIINHIIMFFLIFWAYYIVSELRYE